MLLQIEKGVARVWTRDFPAWEFIPEIGRKSVWCLDVLGFGANVDTNMRLHFDHVLKSAPISKRGYQNETLLKFFGHLSAHSK